MTKALALERTVLQGTSKIAVSIGENTLYLNGREAEALLKRLALARAAMKPRVAEQLSPVHRYLLEMDPSWHVEPHPDDAGLVLLIRHRAYGWTGSVIPDEHVRDLLSRVTAYLSLPEPPRTLAN